MTERAPRPDRVPPIWTAAKWAVLLAYVALIGALLVAPAVTVTVFWNILIPLLPAVFLINVELWRNVCPLATLNSIRGEERAARPLSKRAVRIACLVGIAALVACLPLRKAALNADGVATAALLAGAGLMALGSGLRFQRKAGFCNSICPVLPVERLYGVHPIATVTNARCTPCRACTRSGCIDLGTERAVLQVMGEHAATRRWVATPFGAFALAFPGMVAAFYLLPAGVGITGACLGLAAGAVASWAALSAMVAFAGVPAPVALTWVAAVAAAVYYWFTPLATIGAFDLPGAFVAPLRVVGLALVLAWLILALRRRASATVQLQPRRGSLR